MPIWLEPRCGQSRESVRYTVAYFVTYHCTCSMTSIDTKSRMAGIGEQGAPQTASQ